MNPFVIQELAVSRRDVATEFLRVSLAGLKMERKEELLTDQRPPRPDIVGGKYTKFLHGKTFEHRLYVFRINVFAFLGDDHVFLAAEELQMSGSVEAAKVAGHQPAVENSFGGELRIVQVT